MSKIIQPASFAQLLRSSNMMAAHPEQIFSTEKGNWGGKRTLPHDGPKFVQRKPRLAWNAEKLGIERGQLRPSLKELDAPSDEAYFTTSLDSDNFEPEWLDGTPKANQVKIWKENFAGKAGKKAYTRIRWQTDKDGNISAMSHDRFKALLSKVRDSKQEYQEWLKNPSENSVNALTSPGGRMMQTFLTGHTPDQVKFVEATILGHQGQSGGHDAPDLKVHPPDYGHHLEKREVFGGSLRSTAALNDPSDKANDPSQIVRGRILSKSGRKASQVVVGVAGFTGAAPDLYKDKSGELVDYVVEEAYWVDKNTPIISLNGTQDRSRTLNTYVPPPPITGSRQQFGTADSKQLLARVRSTWGRTSVDDSKSGFKGSSSSGNGDDK